MKKLLLSAIPFVLLALTSCVKQPSACFEVSDSEVQVDEVIKFFDCSSDALNYDWDFGDGYTYTGTNPLHAYTEPGTYEVTLIVTSRFRKKSEAISKEIVVEGNPAEDILGNWSITAYRKNGLNLLDGSESGTISCNSGGSVYYENTYSGSGSVTFYEDGDVNLYLNYYASTVREFFAEIYCTESYDSESFYHDDSESWYFTDDGNKITVYYLDDSNISYAITYDLLEATFSYMKWQGYENSELVVLEFLKD